MSESTDIIILGGGLAGLTLARHLLLQTDRNVLLVDRSAKVPTHQHKVGESSVQVAGYYYGKVLDLEEHLWREHFMKYNLRFYWKTPGHANNDFEDYSHSYIRNFSNIPCYQIDRGAFETELLRLNCENPRFRLLTGIDRLDVALADSGPHRVTFCHAGALHAVDADWVIDTTGRYRFLARKLGMVESSPIWHGTSVVWVDGLINIEKLTDSSPREIRLNKARSSWGHSPCWAATNHFVGEGYWFWVIPLPGRTSLGLVYDRKCVPHEEVNSPEKLIDWVCRTFPMFARDLPHRRIIEHTCLKEYSYGCEQTISSRRWALSGFAGRFTDPLYSPGSDFISLHNTLIVDAVLTNEPSILVRKCETFEMLMKVLYKSMLPTFSMSYDALGDQEAFAIKYTWELSVYFSFFVFPFINDLSTDLGFLPTYLARFARLGTINKGLQSLISGYFQWKKSQPRAAGDPVFFDFSEVPALRRAESTFYRVGVSATEAGRVLSEQLDNLEELARFVVAWIYRVVLNDERVLSSRFLVENIDFAHVSFDLDAMRTWHCEFCSGPDPGTWQWSFDPQVLGRFQSRDPGPLATVESGDMR